MVGMVQGGTQALSRSLFASMIPRHKSSEFFAFFGVFERYAGILGPLVFAAMVDATGQSRNAMLAVLGFFVIGGAILVFVDVDAGRRAARAGRSPSRLTMSTREQPCRPLARAGGMLDFLPRRLHRKHPRNRARCCSCPTIRTPCSIPRVVWATADRDVRFLAKSTLFDGSFGPVLRGAGAIPVYRKMDHGVDTSKNIETFAAVSAALAAGDAVCIFPEGISHSTGRLEPLRTGAARMALAAERAGTAVALVPGRPQLRSQDRCSGRASWSYSDSRSRRAICW